MKHFRTMIIFLGLAFWAAVPSVRAADYDFKEMTPEIRKALKDRQNRYDQIQSLKRKGRVGENNKGYVTGLQNDASVASLTEAENRDRRVIYEALASQNKLGGNGLLEVQRAFAEVQKEKAGPGDMIQASSGDWKKKSA